MERPISTMGRQYPQKHIEKMASTCTSPAERVNLECMVVIAYEYVNTERQQFCTIAELLQDRSLLDLCKTPLRSLCQYITLLRTSNDKSSTMEAVHHHHGNVTHLFGFFNNVRLLIGNEFIAITHG